MDNLVRLLFHPEQGGWQTGVWFEKRWLAHISTDIAADALAPGSPDAPGFYE